MIIEGVVVGDFQHTNLQGFFVQEEDVDTDADPETSEGIFVYADAVEVEVGDWVRVRGDVNEYYGLTELNQVGTDVMDCGFRPTPNPTPASLTLPFASDTYLERYEEALAHHTAALALAGTAQEQVCATHNVAAAHLLQGHLDEALESFGAALTQLRSLPPMAEAGRVHFGLSHLYALRNEWVEAAEHASRSLEISREFDDVRGVADAYRSLSSIAKRRGDLDTACDYDEKSLQLYRELGDLPRTVAALNNVADSCRLTGRMGQAFEWLSQGLELARRIGDLADEAVLLQTTAELYIDQGLWEPATAHLAQALELAEESGEIVRLIELRWISGAAYQCMGRLENARRHLEEAETLSRDMQHLLFMPRIQLELARLCSAEGRFGEGEEHIASAHRAVGTEPSDAFLGLARGCQGCLCGRRGDWDGAVEHLKESLDYLGRTNLRAEAGKAHLSLGQAYANRGAKGDGGHAREHLLAARSVFRQIQAPGYLAQVDVELSQLER